MGEEKRLVGIVPQSTWLKMLAVGHSLDINKGGLYDSRAGCVDIWASPEDKPAGWESIEITKGALDFPRSYVGAVCSEPVDEYVKSGKWIGRFKLFLEVTPYDRWEKEGRKIRSEKDVLEGEWVWITAKAMHLLQLAETEIEPPEGLYCHLCDAYIKVLLLNDFIKHLIEMHGIGVKSVTLGERVMIETDSGIIEV